MKISTGKTARQIRRREIFARLAAIIDTLAAPKIPERPAIASAIAAIEAVSTESLVNESHQLLFELAELAAVSEFYQLPRVRKRGNTTT